MKWPYSRRPKIGHSRKSANWRASGAGAAD
jgi:hypothetical protein